MPKPNLIAPPGRLTGPEDRGIGVGNLLPLVVKKDYFHRVFTSGEFWNPGLRPADTAFKGRKSNRYFPRVSGVDDCLRLRPERLLGAHNGKFQQTPTRTWKTLYLQPEAFGEACRHILSGLARCAVLVGPGHFLCRQGAAVDVDLVN